MHTIKKSLEEAKTQSAAKVEEKKSNPKPEVDDDVNDLFGY